MTGDSDDRLAQLVRDAADLQQAAFDRAAWESSARGDLEKRIAALEELTGIAQERRDAILREAYCPRRRPVNMQEAFDGYLRRVYEGLR